METNQKALQIAPRHGDQVVSELLDEVFDLAAAVALRVDTKLSPVMTGDFPVCDHSVPDEPVAPLFDSIRARLLSIRASLYGIDHTLDRVDF